MPDPAIRNPQSAIRNPAGPAPWSGFVVIDGSGVPAVGWGAMVPFRWSRPAAEELRTMSDKCYERRGPHRVHGVTITPNDE